MYIVTWQATLMEGPLFVTIGKSEVLALGQMVHHIQEFARERPEYRHEEIIRKKSPAKIVEFFGLRAERVEFGDVLSI